MVTEAAAFSTYAWRASPWGSCSRHCGGGIQEREVFCIEYQKAQQLHVPSEMCLEMHKPESFKECNTRACTPHKLVMLTRKNYAREITCSNLSACGVHDGDSLLCQNKDGWVALQKISHASGHFHTLARV